MRQTVDFSSAEFGLTTEEASARTAQADVDRPFRVLVLGNFHGTGTAPPLSERRALEIDPDNLDDVLASMAPEVRITVPGGATDLRFRSIDDFHPDSIYSRVSAFRDDTREAFLNADRPPSATAPEHAPVPEQPYRPSSGSILDDMLALQSGAAVSPAPARRPDPFEDVIRSIVAPHLEQAPDAAAEERARVGHAWDTALMRSLLHQPTFQQLEAAWRSIELFMRRVSTGGQVRLSVLDLSAEELELDLQAEADASLLRRTFDSFAESHSLAVGLYEFGPDECRLLERLANLFNRIGVPFLAAARPQLLGQTTFAGLERVRELNTSAEFEALRRHPNASSVGLALPRFLLRLPYGRKTAAIDSFDFTEIPGTPQHQEYLWGNSAIVTGIMVARAFEEGGWEGILSAFDPQFERLPVHTFGPAAGPEMTPCAECWMTDDLAVRLIDAGFLAFASLRHRDAIRLLRLQSISERSPRLRAAWVRG